MSRITHHLQAVTSVLNRPKWSTRMSLAKSPNQSQGMTLLVTSNATKSYPKGKWPLIATQMALVTRKRFQNRWSSSKKKALCRVNQICYQTRSKAIRTQTPTLDCRRNMIHTRWSLKSPLHTNQMSLLLIYNSKAFLLINKAPLIKVEDPKNRRLILTIRETLTNFQRKRPNWNLKIAENLWIKLELSQFWEIRTSRCPTNCYL